MEKRIDAQKSNKGEDDTIILDDAVPGEEGVGYMAIGEESEKIKSFNWREDVQQSEVMLVRIL